MKTIRSVILAIAFVVSAPWAGATSHEPGGQFSEGEVRKVDKETKKITIRHGPIHSLDMPAMTMVFQVKDPALLDKVKTGDQIRFVAEKSGGAYFVTHVEARSGPGK